MRFVRYLARHDGSSIQYQDIFREIGISPATQKKLLFALEATFVLRHVPIEGDLKGSALFFEDQAEVSTLARDELSDEQRWSGLIFRNLREQTYYRLGENADYFQYRTRAGVVVPFAVRTPQSVLGFILVRGGPSRRDTAAAKSFLSKYAQSKAVIVTDSNETRVLDDRTVILPASQLLF